MLGCRGCRKSEEEIAYLRVQLDAERAERVRLTNQLIEVTTGKNPVLAAPNPQGSWAMDEHGLAVVREGRETPWVKHPETNEEGCWVEGRWVRRDEYEQWMGHITREAGGAAPLVALTG